MYVQSSKLMTWRNSKVQNKKLKSFKVNICYARKLEFGT